MSRPYPRVTTKRDSFTSSTSLTFAARRDGGSRSPLPARARSHILSNMRTIAITIDEDTLKNVDALIAEADGMRNRSAVIRRAIQEFAERERKRQIETREREIFRRHRRRLSQQARALVGEQARP